MNLENYFRQKSVLITGGSSGIGLAFATTIAKLGATVHLCARRASTLEEASASVKRAAPTAAISTHVLDVTDLQQAKTVVADIVQQGGIDMLVNNAGIVMPGRFLELEPSEFKKQMDTNYFGTVHMCHAVLPHFITKGSGHVLNVSSLAGVIGIYGYTAYASTKFAIVGFSQALRAEMWPHGIVVSVVFPPDTDTPQLAFEDAYKPAETKAISGSIKPLSADEVALSMASGMARGKFEIYCDVASRVSALTQGAAPNLVRWFCDFSQKRVSAS